MALKLVSPRTTTSSTSSRGSGLFGNERNDDASLIANAGWKQGSVLPEHLALKIDTFPAPTKDDLAILVSHSCDIVNDSYRAEPLVEVLLARKIATDLKNGNLFRGKNPRLLQVELNASLYQISILERYLLNRRELEGESPKEIEINGDVISLITRWIAKRYVRAAFPDEFNRRLSQVESKMGALSPTKSEHLSGIYIATTNEELDPSSEYELIVTGTIPVDKFENDTIRQTTQELFDKIVALIDGANGINVVDNALVSEEFFSLDDLRNTRRWDWDAISLKGSVTGAIAPNDT